MKPNVFTAAESILDQTGEISAMKLQKLVYYSQAWSLVWDDSVLFDSPIEAWANGPVVRELYDQHRGSFSVNPGFFEDKCSGDLSHDQRETVEVVVQYYGDKSAQWLSDQSHMEEPWIKARVGLADLERGSQEITLESMAEYYSSI